MNSRLNTIKEEINKLKGGTEDQKTAQRPRPMSNIKKQFKEPKGQIKRPTWMLKRIYILH